MLVRHLCVLFVSFWCLELCIFFFDCLLNKPLAQLRRGAQTPHSSSSSSSSSDDDDDDDDDVQFTLWYRCSLIN